MRIRHIIAGLSLLVASAWLAPMAAEALGSEQIWGFLTVSGLICFAAGFIFRDGLGGS